MTFETELRFRESILKRNDKGEYYLICFLDENDNKYYFFFDTENAKKYLNLKKYDLVKLKLHLYQSKDKNGNYTYKLSISK